MDVNKVVGGSVLIFGDLHFSDVFNGKHKNYLQNCFAVLGKLSKIVEEVKPSAIVLGGDIVGWAETNVRNREVLSVLCRELKAWGDYGTVYAVKGNHDIKGYPEFMFLSDIGIITTSAKCGGYFDYYGTAEQEIPEVRFHIVDYKDEDRILAIHENPNVSNIVLGHNNYTISGVTNWYSDFDGVELGRLQNYSDVDMVISGHIHNPSPEIVSATMISGNTCSLLYPGCPTRPIKEKEMYESCLAVKILYNPTTQSTDIDTITIELEPSSEVFFSDEEFVDEKSEDEVEEQIRKEALHEVLGDLLKYRMNQGDPISQIDRIPNASDGAKEIAKSYLMQALNASQGA